MLNAGNLALIAFSRMHGNQAGQVFALIVMVIAACEVVIGLGSSSRCTATGSRSTSTRCRSSAGERHRLRLARARLPARGADRSRWLAGAARAPAGWIAQRRDPRLVPGSIGALDQLQDLPEEEREVDSAWTYAVDGRLRRRLDPGRPAVGVHVPRGDGVSFLIHVYSVAYMSGDRGYARFFAYLNYFVFSMLLLLVLAANFVP